MSHHVWHRGAVLDGGGPAPNPYAPVLELLGEDGYLWVHTTGVDTGGGGIGSPVESWTDVTGVAVLPRIGPGSKRPTLTASGLLFDGVDDCLTAETLGSEFDPYLSADGATGGTVGFRHASVGTLSQFDRLLTVFTSTNSYQSWYDGVQVLKQSAFPDNFSPLTPVASNVSVAGAIGGAGSAMRRAVDGSVVESTNIGWGDGWRRMTRVVLCSNPTSTSNFWEGTLAAYWMSPRELSAVQLQNLHAAVDALLA